MDVLFLSCPNQVPVQEERYDDQETKTGQGASGGFVEISLDYNVTCHVHLLLQCFFVRIFHIKDHTRLLLVVQVAVWLAGCCITWLMFRSH